MVRVSVRVGVGVADCCIQTAGKVTECGSVTRLKLTNVDPPRSTFCRVSRLAAFLQAEDRPMFKGLIFYSTARSPVYLGRATGRLQSGGCFRIAAETARYGTVWYR